MCRDSGRTAFSVWTSNHPSAFFLLFSRIAPFVEIPPPSPLRLPRI